MENCFSSLLCKLGIHNMEKTAHWCDNDCSVIICEYKCSRCDAESWDMIYFEPDRCKVLTRVPVEIFAAATDCVKCGMETCEANDQPKPEKRKAKAKAKPRSTNC